MNAIDTNVLVYFVDFDEPVKRARAIALVERLMQEESDTVLPWQVAAEFLGCMRRWENNGRIRQDDVRAHLQQMEAMFPVVLPTQSVLQACLDLTARYKLSHWDSMLVAACVEAGVDILYTEDLDAGATYDGVLVVNPFASG